MPDIQQEFIMKVQTVIAAIVLAASGAAFAQAPAATPGIDKRIDNQQKRIDQGVASGQLTAKETNRLDKREAKLAADTTAAKADGKMTKAERRKLRHEANRDSKAIYKQKHDKQTAAPAAAK
jgi:CTP synthase (UTP-ammonia lyase)